MRRGRATPAASIRIPLIAGLALASLAAPLTAQEPALGERQRKVLGFAIGAALAPTEVPAGWRPDRAEVAVRASGAIDYRIVYRGPDGACFEIVGGPPEGFGGPVPPDQRPVAIDALPPGEGVRLYWSDGSDADGPFPEPMAFTDWIPFGDLAHRFASPASPVGTCPAVDPEAASGIVASLVPVGPAAPARDDPLAGGPAGNAPREAFDDHDWQWLSYNDPTVAAGEGESPDRIALRLLDELGMGVTSPEPAGEHAVQVDVEVRERTDGPAAVRITRDGGGDDSVAAVRYLVLLEEVGDGLLEFRIGRAFRCHAGRGHEGWSPEFCL